MNDDAFGIRLPAAWTGHPHLRVIARLEKLDGSLNARFGDCTLELLVPLGARKGLVGPEMLISGLYPWLHIAEKSACSASTDWKHCAAEEKLCGASFF